MWYPARTIDATDLERFNLLHEMAATVNPFQVGYANFSTMYDETRKDCNSTLPNLTLGAFGNAQNVQNALQACLCENVHRRLLNSVLAVYRCDLHYADQADLLRQLRDKGDRFNTFVRLQLAVLGDISLVKQYDKVVATCFHEALIKELAPGGKVFGASKPKRSSPTPSPTPKSTPKPSPKPSLSASPSVGTQTSSHDAARTQPKDYIATIVPITVVVLILAGLCIGVVRNVYRRREPAREYQPLVPATPEQVDLFPSLLD